MDPVTTAALLKWIEALGFPTWTLVILLAWLSLRRELRGLSIRWQELAEEFRKDRLHMEHRLTWVESGLIHHHRRKNDAAPPREPDG